MTSTLRALVWLRFRFTANSVVLGARREAFARLLRMVEHLVPALILAALVPAAAASAGFGLALGLRKGAGEDWPSGLAVARGALVVATVACVLRTGRPALAVAFGAAWLAACVGVAAALFGPAVRFVERRREAVLLVAEGR